MQAQHLLFSVSRWHHFKERQMDRNALFASTMCNRLWQAAAFFPGPPFVFPFYRWANWQSGGSATPVGRGMLGLPLFPLPRKKQPNAALPPELLSLIQVHTLTCCALPFLPLTSILEDACTLPDPALNEPVLSGTKGKTFCRSNIFHHWSKLRACRAVERWF